MTESALVVVVRVANLEKAFFQHAIGPQGTILYEYTPTTFGRLAELDRREGRERFQEFAITRDALERYGHEHPSRNFVGMHKVGLVRWWDDGYPDLDERSVPAGAACPLPPPEGGEWKPIP